MSSSPPPEEREKKDAEAKAREAEEQGKLPYKWTQTIQDVDITVPVPGNLKGRDIDVVITKKKLKVGVKGQPPIIDVSLQLFSTATRLLTSPHAKPTDLANNPISRATSPKISTWTNQPGR